MTATLDLANPPTVQYAVPLWFRDHNIATAIGRVAGRIKPAEQARAEPIAVVGFGPSLTETMEEIRRFHYIVTCSGAHKYLIERGMIPTHHVEVDPRPHKVALLGPPHPDVEYLIASACAPAYFDHLEGFNVKLWHVFDATDEGLRTLPPGEWAVTGGCDAGLRAMTIAAFLGFRDLHIFGLDGCARGEERHAAEHPNGKQKYQSVEHEGRTYWTTAAMLVAAKQTLHELEQMPAVRATFYGDGLTQALSRGYTPKKAAEPSTPYANIIAFSKPELISAEYARLNAQLHRENVAYGVGGAKHAAVVLKLVDQITPRPRSVLDYGCGKSQLSKALPFGICEYDPAIPGKQETPKPADLVVCFPAGTIIGGSTRYIEELAIGDPVGAGNGTEQRVTQTFRRTYSGEMVTLKVATVPDVEMTAEHPLLVSRLRRIHRKQARNGGKSHYEFVVDDYSWKAAKNVQLGDWVSVPRITETAIPALRFVKGRGKHPVECVVDEETAWLIGLYVAEGFTSYPAPGAGRMTLSLGAGESLLAERAVAAFGCLGVTASVDRSKVPSGVILVNVSTVSLCRLFDEWCGKGAAHKVVPEPIKFAPESLVRAFLTGLVDGDGCLRQSAAPSGGKGVYRYYSVTTVSKRLAYGVLELLHKIGIHGTLANPSKRRSGIICGRTVAMRPAYVVSWSKRSWDGTPNRNGKVPYGRSRFIGSRVYLPVRGRATRLVKDEPVYNIETEDHTYAVPYTVHNCTDVLEHIEPDRLNYVLDDLRRCTLQLGYFVINTGPAQKTLPNGANTHQIQKGKAWWYDKLKKFFQIGQMLEKGMELYVVVGPKQASQSKGPRSPA